jgi:hypothetical protein
MTFLTPATGCRLPSATDDVRTAAVISIWTSLTPGSCDTSSRA